MFDKLWAAAADNPNSHIRRYENRTEKYFAYLVDQGFHNITIDAMATVNYAPDCDNVDDEMAQAQINNDRMLRTQMYEKAQSSVEKAYKMAPNALDEREYQTLLDMVHRRYDRKIQAYLSGNKSWEFRIVTTVIISGTK